jgi:hypothetical protein
MTHPTHGLDPNELEAAVLPCDIHLPPATTLCKGVSLAALLTGLKARGMVLPDLAALSQNPGTSNTSGEAGKWHDIEYLMSIIDAAIEDGFDPDEDGPLLDEIRAEVKAGKHRLAALASSERSGREAVDLAEIERVARKVNPGRSEDHIKSVALDCLSIIRNLAGTKTNG